jgi:hypothetical protein
VVPFADRFERYRITGSTAATWEVVMLEVVIRAAAALGETAATKSKIDPSGTARYVGHST